MKGLAMYASLGGGSADDLIARSAPQVKRIAYHLLARLPASVQVDDLIQAGMLGLLEATRRYDPAQGASFTTFAEPRIRGAMLDEIRKGDWTPRSVHRKAREVATAIHAVETATGCEAHDRDIAEHLGIPLAEYHVMLTDLRGQKILSLEEAMIRLKRFTGVTCLNCWPPLLMCCPRGRNWCCHSTTTKSCI